jgi:hypothetical protein
MGPDVPRSAVGWAAGCVVWRVIASAYSPGWGDTAEGLCVSIGRPAVEVPVFPGELAGTGVANSIGGCSCVEGVDGHEPTCLALPQSLLVLEWRHAGGRAEMLVQAGRAYVHVGGRAGIRRGSV